MFGITTKKAMDKLKRDLKNDAEYRKSWEDNISMCIQDRASQMRFTTTAKKLQQLADKSAKDFIELLIS